MRLTLFLHALVAVAVALAVAAANETKQLYRVTASKEVFDATLPEFHGRLDVWHTFARGNDLYEARVYATDAEIAVFQNASATIERDAVDTPTLLETRAADRAACASNSRRRRLQRQNATQTTTRSYVDDEFFDCFRQANEVFAFLDRLVDENPTIMTKIPEITTTIEGRSVPGYKISTGRGRQALYTQSLIHAREWVAGSATFFAIAALLDDLRAGRGDATTIFQSFDWHFVPILNLDGYLYSWKRDRLWRKNRRKIGSEYGVDLNRNFGPASFFGKGDDDTSSESYPGTKVLSEPETAGMWAYVQRLNPMGVLDMHSFGGFVMRAYGNQRGTPPAPYGPKLKALGDIVAKAAGADYVSQTSAQMYEAYGCFDDAVFQLLNRPVLTIEMAGESFIADESTIRPSGRDMYRAFLAFGLQIPTYWKGLNTNSQSTNRVRRDLDFDVLADNGIQRSD